MESDDPRLQEMLKQAATRVAVNLRRLTHAQGISIRKLSRLSAVNTQTLSDLLKARANPTLKTLVMLANALDVDAVEFLQPIPDGAVIAEADADQRDDGE